MPGRKLWSYVEIARHIGVQAETVRHYKRHGLLPNPDRLDALGRPRWYPQTIRDWARARPGRR